MKILLLILLFSAPCFTYASKMPKTPEEAQQFLQEHFNPKADYFFGLIGFPDHSIQRESRNERLKYLLRAIEILRKEPVATETPIDPLYLEKAHNLVSVMKIICGEQQQVNLLMYFEKQLDSAAISFTVVSDIVPEPIRFKEMGRGVALVAVVHAFMDVVAPDKIPFDTGHEGSFARFANYLAGSPYRAFVDPQLDVAQNLWKGAEKFWSGRRPRSLFGIKFVTDLVTTWKGIAKLGLTFSAVAGCGVALFYAGYHSFNADNDTRQERRGSPIPIKAGFGANDLDAPARLSNPWEKLGNHSKEFED